MRFSTPPKKKHDTFLPLVDVKVLPLLIYRGHPQDSLFLNPVYFWWRENDRTEASVGMLFVLRASVTNDSK